MTRYCRPRFELSWECPGIRIGRGAAVIRKSSRPNSSRLRASAFRDHRPFRHSGRGRQPRRGAPFGGRRSDDQAPRRRRDLVHRIGRNRSPDSRRLHCLHEEVPARNGQEESASSSTMYGNPAPTSARQSIERATPGFYLGPTLFTDVRNDMRIARDEIFGPVAAVIRARDYDDAPFGLCSGICTTRLELRTARAGTLRGRVLHDRQDGVHVDVGSAPRHRARHPQ